MKVFLMKFAAYVVFVLGILLGIACFLGGIAMFFVFSDANMAKSIPVGIALIIAAILFVVIGYAIFEALLNAAKEAAKGGPSEETTWRSNKDAKSK